MQKNDQSYKREVYYKIRNNEVPLIYAEINIDQYHTKFLEIYSFNNLEDEINNFCYKNNLIPKVKLYIKKAIIQGINTKINECKLFLI